MSFARSTPIWRDPDKAREFVERNRKPLARTGSLRRTASKRRRGLTPAKARAIDERSNGLCLVCAISKREALRLRAGWERHHVLPVRLFPELETDPDNIVRICGRCHDCHERAFRRIPYELVPKCALALAVRVGPKAEAYIERTYPRAP